MAQIIIELSKCTNSSSGCTRCMDECPMQLIEEAWFSQNGKFVHEEELCIECRNCEVTCPEKAFEVLAVA